jgi:hypothetical protein
MAFVLDRPPALVFSDSILTFTARDHFLPLEARFTLSVSSFCIQTARSEGTAAATPFEIQKLASLSLTLNSARNRGF